MFHDARILYPSYADKLDTWQGFDLARPLLHNLVKQYGVGIWLDPETMFHQPSAAIAHIQHSLLLYGWVGAKKDNRWVVEGYSLESSMFHQNVEQALLCRRGYHLLCEQPVALAPEDCDACIELSTLVGTEKQIPSHKYHCDIEFRDDIVYSLDTISPLNVTEDAERSRTDHRRVIGIGVPTTSSKLRHWNESSILTTFIPHFLRSIDDKDLAAFRFKIYIGYDANDRYWDFPDTMKLYQRAIHELLKDAGKLEKSVEVEYVRLPYTHGWVTFIWNRLYAHSMSAGDDYFYQVNDDLELVTTGWARSFVAFLDNTNGFGVVGPNDQKWNCTILTQAMVSRHHWSIFGSFYPQEVIHKRLSSYF
jgi:hypothetical protein